LASEFSDFPSLGPSASPSDARSSNVDKHYDEYQPRRLWGSTTQELIYLDAISNRSLKPNNLMNKTHKVLRYWESEIDDIFPRKNLYPIGNGFNGDVNWSSLPFCPSSKIVMSSESACYSFLAGTDSGFQ
jgi:hypothetical protein